MGLFGLTADDIGEVAAPGRGTISLPAGKVKVRYVEDRSGRSVDSEGHTWRGPGRDLKVTISAGGQELAIEKTRRINEGSVIKKIYRELGSIQLPVASTCEVTVEMELVDGEHFNPRIAFRA